MNEIEKATKTLKDAGYFVDNLWHVDDVKDNYPVSDEQAQKVLYSALTNDATMEQIWLAISMVFDVMYEEGLIIEATIYFNDEPDRLIDVLFGVGLDPADETYDEKIFYYLDYPEEIRDFIDSGVSDFTVVKHSTPKPINEIFI